jgi:hypothetical protein
VVEGSVIGKSLQNTEGRGRGQGAAKGEEKGEEKEKGIKSPRYRLYDPDAPVAKYRPEEYKRHIGKERGGAGKGK